jgi:hypothetical protein
MHRCIDVSACCCLCYSAIQTDVNKHPRSSVSVSSPSRPVAATSFPASTPHRLPPRVPSPVGTLSPVLLDGGILSSILSSGEMCGVRQLLHSAPQTLPLSLPLTAAHAEHTAYVATVEDSFAPPPLTTRGSCGEQDMPDGGEGLLTIVTGQQVNVFARV